MKLPSLLIALFIIAIGIVGVIAPYRLLSLGQYSVTPIGLYVVAALRVGIGLVLFRVASASRAPKTLRVFGVVAVIAGLTTPLLGVGRALAIRDWWLAQGPMAIRLWAGVFLVIGVFIAYAVAAGRRPA